MKLITNKKSVSVVDMNPTLAKQILSLNVKNRKLTKFNLSSTVYKMRTGKWHENGESIIIGSDSPGSIKPKFVGQIFVDTTNQIGYLAVGPENTDWKQITPITP